jgi:hypothetical protein
VEKAQAAKIKVVLLTATVIHENLDSPENGRLAPYNDYVRSLAKDKNLPLADLNAMFHEKIKAANEPTKKILTGDGVHMNGDGNKLMATGVLKAFGLNDAQLAKANEAWAPLVVRAAADAKAAAEAKAAAAAKKAAESKQPAAPAVPAAK